MSSADEHARNRDSGRPLTVYLRDHFAGATAGVALVRRVCDRDTDAEVRAVLAGLDAEIAEDRRELAAIMERLGVEPSRFKSAVGRVAETVGRLKGNGRIVRHSPTSPVVELEGLAAGIVTKRNLWRALREAAAAHHVLDVRDLEALERRASSQLERVSSAHDRAAVLAFGGGADAARGAPRA